jgi:hypothetical protein|tara:strand:+ start:450 stop:764 length:315 start_codon:yes stop_codon:yes gene_type:complete
MVFQLGDITVQLASTQNTYGKVAGFGLEAASALASSSATKHWVLRNIINQIYDKEYYSVNPGRKTGDSGSRRSSNNQISSSRSSRDRYVFADQRKNYNKKAIYQ